MQAREKREKRTQRNGMMYFRNLPAYINKEVNCEVGLTMRSAAKQRQIETWLRKIQYKLDCFTAQR